MPGAPCAGLPHFLQLRRAAERVGPRLEPGRIGTGHRDHRIGPVLRQPPGDQVGVPARLRPRRELLFPDG